MRFPEIRLLKLNRNRNYGDNSKLLNLLRYSTIYR